MGCRPLTTSVHVRGISGYLTHLPTTQIQKNREQYMGTHRTWDESQSPQWRYFQEKESIGKRNRRKTIARKIREEITPAVPDTAEKRENINSELKKEKVKYDIKAARLSTESIE